MVLTTVETVRGRIQTCRDSCTDQNKQLWFGDGSAEMSVERRAGCKDGAGLAGISKDGECRKWLAALTSCNRLLEALSKQHKQYGPQHRLFVKGSLSFVSVVKIHRRTTASNTSETTHLSLHMLLFFCCGVKWREGAVTVIIRHQPCCIIAPCLVAMYFLAIHNSITEMTLYILHHSSHSSRSMQSFRHAG